MVAPSALQRGNAEAGPSQAAGTQREAGPRDGGSSDVPPTQIALLQPC
jgi:hypothetical protein